MKDQPQRQSDQSLDKHPDDRHSPDPAVTPDKLGPGPGRGRTDLRPGGATDAEQLLDQQSLKRPDKPDPTP